MASFTFIIFGDAIYIKALTIIIKARIKRAKMFKIIEVNKTLLKSSYPSFKSASSINSEKALAIMTPEENKARLLE
ncbi:MAG: hypothetical protein LBS81_03600 [Endomicrobium sp.]|nr:hypothetical protein [Endomicrobium sp.]